MVIQLVEISEVGSVVVDWNVWVGACERLSRTLKVNGEEFGEL